MLLSAFIVLLIGVLIAAVISFAIMGLVQVRRTRTLDRQAQEMKMRFSATDPFDVPRRYADFALISSGHSARANNVTYGRLGGRRVRTFDFRYEVGHGTRRMTRRYRVIVVEGDRELPAVLMWSGRDAGSWPLQTTQTIQRVACWSVRGEVELAEKVGDHCSSLVDESASLQTCGSVLMVFTPVRRGRGGFDRHGLADAVHAMRVIESHSAEQAEPDTP